MRGCEGSRPVGPRIALHSGKRLDLDRGRRRHTDATGDESLGWSGHGRAERGWGRGTSMTRGARAGCELGADMPTAHVMA